MQVLESFKEKLFQGYLSAHANMNGSSHLHLADAIGGPDNLKKDLLSTVRKS